MSKTPYEIRLDVLKMAQEMVEKENDVYLTTVNAMISSNAYSENEVKNYIDNNQTSGYSVSDVTSTAESLYSFVNDNSNVRSGTPVTRTIKPKKEK